MEIIKITPEPDPNLPSCLKDWIAQTFSDYTCVGSALEKYLIEFSEPKFLDAPFFEKYGMVTILDHRLFKDRKLKSELEYYNEYRDHQMVSVRNLPHAEIENLKVECDEYVTCAYDNETKEPCERVSADNITVFTPNTNPKSSTNAHPYARIAKYGKYQFTTLEIFELLEKKIRKFEFIECLELFDCFKKNFNENMKRYDMRVIPSLDKPFYLQLSGANDSSWGRNFKSLDELNMVFDKIKQKPTYQTIKDNLATE